MSTLASVIQRDTAANRPAASIAGRLFFDTTNTKLQRDNGSSWDDVAETTANLGSWSTYSPTWSATGTAPSLGNGTLSGRYIDSGKVRFLHITLTPGSTTTFGTGNYRFTYPSGTVSVRSLLNAFSYDSSAGQYRSGLAMTNYVDTTHIAVVKADGTGTEWGQTSPITWAQSDQLVITGVMEID